uniref:Uncharacterized protein n=1 Tax=Anguilla anguilla TaxID=7936 RepID=A0A0E9VBP8_ANGAN
MFMVFIAKIYIYIFKKQVCTRASKNWFADF